MFSSVDLIDESNIHSKDVSSWIEFTSYISFAKPQKKWFTEIGKMINILERERILKILLSNVEDKRLQGWRFSWLWAGQTTGDCDILGLNHVQSGRSLIFSKSHQLHTLWENFENASIILQRMINFVAWVLKWFRVFWLLFVFRNSCKDNRVQVPSQQTALIHGPSASSNS